MQQGNRRKEQKESRRKAFARNAAGASPRPGGLPQAPAAGVPMQPTQIRPHGAVPAPYSAPRTGIPAVAVPVAPMESQPGAIRSSPPPQVQPHQAVGRSGEAFSPGAPVFAAQNNVAVPAHYTPPQEDRTVRPTNQISGRPTVSVTVILYSGGQSAQFTANQFEALRRQSVQPEKIIVHVDGPLGHDEKTLQRAVPVRTPTHFGRYHRLPIARSGATTKYVAVLDEDTIPGVYWLERTISGLERAEAEGDNPFGAAVVANAGAILVADDPSQVRFVGPEYPSIDNLEVDFGRGGWVFRTELIRIIESLPWAGFGRYAFSFAISAAAHVAGLPIIVQAYGPDQSDWGSLRPATYLDDPSDVATAYQHYRTCGWDPASLASAQDSSDAAQGESEAWQGESSDAPALPPMADSPAPPPSQHAPMPQSPTAPMPPGMGGAPAPVAMDLPPGAKVTRMGGMTQIEHVLTEPTPEPEWKKTERVLTQEEATPEPEWKQTERTLHASEATPPPAYTQTERVVPRSPTSPAQAETGGKRP